MPMSNVTANAPPDFLLVRHMPRFLVAPPIRSCHLIKPLDYALGVRFVGLCHPA